MLDLMTSPLTSEDIARYRSQLSDIALAQIALNAIEDVDGDFELATIRLALQIGEHHVFPDWIAHLVKHCLPTICYGPIRQSIEGGDLATALAGLIESNVCPAVLATPVLIYASRLGLCRDLR